MIDKDMYMKKKSVLAKQSIKKKQTNHPAHRFVLWDLARFLMSVSFKVSIVIVGMISVSLLLVYLYKSIITSSCVRLQEIEITGVDDGIKRELIKMAGLNADVSLLAINPVEIKAKMEKHPWIRSVELEKRFPHTLIVKVEKQSPRALVAFDKMFYMNRWGKIFKEVSQGDDMDFPVVTGISKGQDNTDEKLTLAARIIDSFASEGGFWSYNDISEIHVNDSGDAMIYSMSLPCAIRVGGENLEDEKHKLKQLVSYLQNTGGIETVNVIDMNYHGGAVVSIKRPEGVDPS
jgi:cell division protein FtsQ